MSKTIVKLAILAALLASFSRQQAWAIDSDYAQDVAIQSNPSPEDDVTGSSINQFGKGQTNSQVDNYLAQDEQINLDKNSGIVKVLRTNQKVNVNDFVTEIIELKYAKPRELRGVARTICRKEGGDADTLHDKVTKHNYMVVVCPPWQLPFIRETLQAIDQPWVTEVNDGSWSDYYKLKNRDADSVMRILQFYRSPDGVTEIDEANNAVMRYDQPNTEGLWRFGTKSVDIPPSQLMMDVAIYEVDKQNDLALGFDWESWKAGPGRFLFDFAAWDFDGDDDLNLFPGGHAGEAADWGHFRSSIIYLSSAYIDFLQSKGKARLLTKSTITAKSGTVGELEALDEIASFLRGTNHADPKDFGGSAPMRLSALWTASYNRDKSSTNQISLGQLTEMPAGQAKKAIREFLERPRAGGNNDSAAQVMKQLDTIGNGQETLKGSDLDDIFVPIDFILDSFHDRTLEYRRAGRIGLLLTMLPVVGLESAEVALALDVTDVNGYTPAGEPIIEHRYFSSTVEVKDGQPFVLGGIDKTISTKSASGMPFLREIPYLGYAFGRETSVKREKEIVVFLTPRFELCTTNATQPPEEVKTAIEVAAGKEPLQVPHDSWGFDQWLLDPAKGAK